MKKVIMSCVLILNMASMCQEIAIQFPSHPILQRNLYAKKINNSVVMEMVQRLGSKNMPLKGVAFAITAACQKSLEEEIEPNQLVRALIEYAPESDPLLEKLEELLRD